MTPLELRADIPALQDGVYLNHGAHGPSPRHVVETAEDFLTEHEYESPLGDDPYETAFSAFDRVRETVSGHVGGAPDEIALTESTTAGINAIAGAIDWKRGDVVVRTDLEHPAGVLPWRRLEREGVEVRVVETEHGRIDTESFATAVDGARLACFSAITWTHGTKLPVADLVDLAHEGGALALVDAVQVPGQTAIDVEAWGADAVAAAGHKWLLGLWGGGFLYVDRAVAEALSPMRVGYRSVETPTAADIEFAAGARRFEVGSANPAAHVALAKAVETIEAVGLGTIEARIGDLTGRLAEGVGTDRVRGPAEPESGLVTVGVSDPEVVVERLAGEDVVVRSVPGMDAIRASVHAVNTSDDVDAFLAGFQQAV